MSDKSMKTAALFHNCVEDLDQEINLHKISEEKFNLMILAGNIDVEDIDDVDFDPISVGYIKGKLRKPDGSGYKDCSLHHVKLVKIGDTITFDVVAKKTAIENSLCIDMQATYPMVLFIAVIEKFFPEASSDQIIISFATAKAINYDGRIMDVIAFKFFDDGKMYYFDYSQEDPEIEAVAL